ncbi:MAG: AI-2E family transporter [Pseudomonadota bacterium]
MGNKTPNADGDARDQTPSADGPQPASSGTLGVEAQAAFWLVAALGLVLLIGLLKDVLLPFVIGIVVAYCLNPAADYLERKGVSRPAASGGIVAVLIILLMVLLIYLVPLLVSQAQQFALALPGQMEQLKVLMENFARDKLGSSGSQAERAVQDAFAALNGHWDQVATWAARSIWTQGMALFNLLTLLLIMPLVVFYILSDWKPMLAKLDSYLPRQHAAPLRQLAADINGAVGAFIRGQGLVCLILGIFYAIALSLVGLEYGMLIGIATGVVSFVPLVGWVLGLIVASVLAVVQFWPDVWPIFLVIGVFMAGQALDTAFLSPSIVGSRVGLHPVWVIFALIAFSYLFGIVGVLIAIPLAAAVAVIVRFALNAYLESAVYTGEVSQPRKG